MITIGTFAEEIVYRGFFQERLGWFLFIDSIIYSVIYHRTRNIVASWISQYLADIFGVVAILLLFK